MGRSTAWRSCGFGRVDRHIGRLVLRASPMHRVHDGYRFVASFHDYQTDRSCATRGLRTSLIWLLGTILKTGAGRPVTAAHSRTASTFHGLRERAVVVGAEADRGRMHLQPTPRPVDTNLRQDTRMR